MMTNIDPMQQIFLPRITVWQAGKDDSAPLDIFFYHGLLFWHSKAC